MSAGANITKTIMKGKLSRVLYCNFVDLLSQKGFRFEVKKDKLNIICKFKLEFLYLTQKLRKNMSHTQK